MSVLIHNARLVTLAGDSDARTGVAMRDTGVIERGWVHTEGDHIVALGSGQVPEEHRLRAARVIDADGRALLPGFVDCHTHACWAGDRLDEWEMRLRGATYLELLEAGGGIMSTVRAVRAASEDELSESLLERLAAMLAEGTTSVEVKSGYGLTTCDELKMLRAIVRAGERWPGTLVPTACIGHALDPDLPDHVERAIAETLPAVTAEFPGIAIDAYCERGAWSLEDCRRLFDAARAAGHPCRVHADQFHALGMLDLAIEREFVSVDHLEATDTEGLARLASSETFGVMLPCSGFHVDQRYANGREFLDAGGRLAIATNCNPGSAPCVSMPMAMALAVRELGLTPSETILAATRSPSALLSLEDRGRIAQGARADLVVLRHQDERELAHAFGGGQIHTVVCGGAVIERD